MNILFEHTEQDDITDMQQTKNSQFLTWNFQKPNEKQAFQFEVCKILFFSITALYHTAVLLDICDQKAVTSCDTDMHLTRWWFWLYLTYFNIVHSPS